VAAEPDRRIVVGVAAIARRGASGGPNKRRAAEPPSLLTRTLSTAAADGYLGRRVLQGLRCRPAAADSGGDGGECAHDQPRSYDDQEQRSDGCALVGVA
jgi:hypothetical protein